MKLAKFSSVFLRLALGMSFLSAVADRFGFWGAYGQPNVSWGNYARFVDYTARLNWYLPTILTPTLAMIATAAETLFGVLLVRDWKTRFTAILSGLLLSAFALTMTIALGVKAPLNFSVFSAAGGAFLLATCAEFPFSLDSRSGHVSAITSRIADHWPAGHKSLAKITHRTRRHSHRIAPGGSV
jgi:uncharacterized membrane protein YphA (DoxX/SURF4 family)